MAAPTASGDTAGGYVLLGVMIGVALLAVGLSAAVPLWSRVLQREREAELVFRGEAVVRAIERFQEERPGVFPESLEELVDGRYLRSVWLDPMTGRPFRLLRVGDEPSSPPAAGEPEDPDADDADDAGEAAEGPSPTGIFGIVSTSTDLGFRLYQGQRRYSDWRFTTTGAPRPQ